MKVITEAKTAIQMNRFNGYVKLTHATGNLTIEDLLIACEDNDFSLDSYTTGHLMLLDDRYEVAYMLNDYWIDVIDVLNDCGNFTARLSILPYSDFKRD